MLAPMSQIAVGMESDVAIMDISIPGLAYLDDIFGSRIQMLVSTDANSEKAVKEAVLMIYLPYTANFGTVEAGNYTIVLTFYGTR